MTSTPTPEPQVRTPSPGDGGRPVVAPLLGVALVALLIPVAQWIGARPPKPDDNPPQVVVPPPPEVLEPIPQPKAEEPAPKVDELKDPPAVPPDLDHLTALGPIVGNPVLPNPDGRIVVPEPDEYVVGVIELDSSPKALFTVAPQYPDAMRRASIGGRVLLEFIVDRQGNVRMPRVVESPNPAFDQSALQAVRQWRFEIGRKNGQPVEFRMRLPLVFTPPDRL